MTHNQSTVITLTLPESDSVSRDGTLLIQRGDLARLHRRAFTSSEGMQ